MKKILIWLFLFFYSVSAFAQVKAVVKDAFVLEQQPFQLELTAASVTTKPDYSPLEEDFDIVGDSIAQSVYFINGRMVSEQKIILTLIAKKTGVLTIPALEWNGQKTNAIQVEVKPASDSVQIKDETAVFIDAKPLTATTYQGAGITYRVDVFDRLGFFDVYFIPPYLADAQIVPLGEYKLSQKEKDGKLYQVFTQDYIIFPEKSGDLTILPASFKGAYRQKNSQPFGFEDSFIFQPFGRKEIIVRAKKSNIQVLPRPNERLKQWWLPSLDVKLSEEWTNLDNAKVGQPITRYIQLHALNVLGNMLPDIEIQGSEDFKVYAEKVQKTQTYEDGIGLIANENRTFVFIPLKSGKLTLPAVSLTWFDVSSGEFKEAFLPAKNIEVADNPQIITTQPSSQAPLSAEQKSGDVQIEEKPFVKENKMLYFINGLGIGLIIGLLAVVILLHKRPKKNKLPPLYPQNK